MYREQKILKDQYAITANFYGTFVQFIHLRPAPKAEGFLFPNPPFFSSAAAATSIFFSYLILPSIHSMKPFSPSIVLHNKTLRDNFFIYPIRLLNEKFELEHM